MKKENIKKVVLAYSGGLDTSIIIPWLKENYNNCEVVAVSGDVGQGTELDGLEEKAKATGASKLYVLDLKKDFVENYIFPEYELLQYLVMNKGVVLSREKIEDHIWNYDYEGGTNTNRLIPHNIFFCTDWCIISFCFLCA